MIGFRESYPRSTYERVGFMQGFLWTRKAALDFPGFSQYWYGDRQDAEPVFKALHQ